MVTTLAFGGLASRLAFLHLSEHDTVDQKIARMHMLERPISVGRGRILDRNGHVLAIDLPACDVMINPRRIKSSGLVMDVASTLASVLDRPIDELYLKIKDSDRLGLRIERFAAPEIEEALVELDRQAVWTEEMTLRNYPQEEMLCHVLGFVNWEGQPGGGVEQEFDKTLRGRDGLWVGMRDGQRKELYGKRQLEVEPMPGSDLVLTIDQNLQAMLEAGLDAMMEEHNPEAGWAIMQDVRSGEILALASRPHFVPNEFRFSDKEQRRNRALSYLYEPGSTFKPLVIAAALEEGAVGPDDIFFCENGRWSYGGRSLRDTHGYGELSVGDIVKKSSNIGTAKIALELGEEKVYEYIRKFGFGSPSGIELPGEESGIVHPPGQWSAISITRLAMGHEIAVTALQQVNGISALVNGGYLMRPTIIKRIVDAEGRVVSATRPQVLRRVVSSKTSALMRRMLAAVIDEEGTGRRAQIPGYLVGGKTGTAQKPIPGEGYSNSQHFSSFVGFLSADAPEIAIVVVADNPQPHHYGGVVAAPAFKRIAEQAVRYLNIPPSHRPHIAELSHARGNLFEEGRP
jgi:cell division protein FtsI (penicillin-binding protein 3)